MSRSGPGPMGQAADPGRVIGLGSVWARDQWPEPLSRFLLVHTPHKLSSSAVEEKVMDRLFLVTELTFGVTSSFSLQHIVLCAIALCQISHSQILTFGVTGSFSLQQWHVRLLLE